MQSLVANILEGGTVFDLSPRTAARREACRNNTKSKNLEYGAKQIRYATPKIDDFGHIQYQHYHEAIPPPSSYKCNATQQHQQAR